MNMRYFILLFPVIMFAGCEYEAGYGLRPPVVGRYTDLDSALEDPSSVRELILTDIGDSLSPEIGQFPRLYHLEIRDSPIRFLPEEIGELKLTRLKLVATRLEHIPPQIWRYKNIYDLSIIRSTISTVPDSLISSNIHILELSLSKLKSLPEWMQRWEQLDGSLILDNCEFEHFSAGENAFPGVWQMGLRRNSLRTFEAGPNSFRSLKILYLHSNKLTEFNVSSGSMRNLQSLDLKYNNLTDFQVPMSALPGLEYLSLTGNPIPPASVERIRQSFPNTRVIF
ncbi:MAG: leucine-rich repeat domain-containing protein [Bacteroidetes bacterium]|nr:leucine-rich repeat domain-containing protein [Bacteroidota bacterium]